MPFANDNAGTIKQRNARAHPALAALNYSSAAAAAVMSPSMGRRSTNMIISTTTTTTTTTSTTNLGQHCTSIS